MSHPDPIHDLENVRIEDSSNAPTEVRTATALFLSVADFHVGDGVHWGAGTDTESGTVVEVTGQRVFVVEDRTELLNAANSDKPNALTFSPGGFVGHTSGNQEYAFYPGTGRPLVFSLRKKLARFKLAGTSVNGSMMSWGLLSKGRCKHYDYNF